MNGEHTVLCSVQGTNTVLSTIHSISSSRLREFTSKTSSLTGMSRKRTSKKCGIVIETCFTGIYKNSCGEIASQETITALILSAYISLILIHSIINSSVALFYWGRGNSLLGTKGGAIVEKIPYF